MATTGTGTSTPDGGEVAVGRRARGDDALDAVGHEAGLRGAEIRDGLGQLADVGEALAPVFLEAPRMAGPRRPISRGTSGRRSFEQGGAPSVMSAQSLSMPGASNGGGR